jgi:hypothetical protein
MEWITRESLATAGGAALAVMLVVSLAKALFGVSGRTVQGVALVVSMVIAAIVFPIYTWQTAFTACLNGCVICAAAIGINEAKNYGR